MSLEHNIFADKAHLEERKSLINASLETAKSFDKAILTLSAAAFGISLTFIRQIAPYLNRNTIPLLITSWIFFALSILSTLIAFLTSQAASLRQIDILESYFSGNVEISNQSNAFIFWTWLFNIASIITFIIGTISLSIFSIINIYN
jgi:hypothetical protein